MKKFLIYVLAACIFMTGCSTGQTQNAETTVAGTTAEAETDTEAAEAADQTTAAENGSGSGQETSGDSSGTGILGDYDNAGTAADRAKTQNTDPVSVDIFAMDTYMTLTAYGDRAQEALDAATAEIERLDDLLSVGNEDSEIAIINNNGTGTISDDTEIMFEEGMQLYQDTNGAFDMTIYPLMEAWGFTTQNYRVPEQSEIDELLSEMGSDKITYDEAAKTVTLADGQGIDFGAIAKGYTSARVMEIFHEYDLVCGLVSLGGNVQCYSCKPDGSAWRCAVQNPDESSSDYLGIVSVVDKAVITSGGYERYFVDEATGKTYHHIIDPATGYSADSGLISVSIVSDNGMLADGLSTSVFIMGLDKATEYWRAHSDEFDMILMDEDQNVYCTEGISDSFKTDYDLTVITK